MFHYAEFLRIGHLILLGLWGGIVLTESVIELLPLWKKELMNSTATFHYFIDLFVELPIIALVVITGFINLLFVPLTSLQIIKVLAGFAAVGANIYCISRVVSRYRGLIAGAHETVISAEHRRVIRSAKIGLPFAFIALALGLRIALNLPR